MDYIGSKVKLNDWMFAIMQSLCGDLSGKTFMDACSGSGAVSKKAATLGCTVLASDMLSFSAAVVNGCIGLSPKQKSKALSHLQRLNSLEGVEGYFYHNYSDEGTPPRTYFTADNARKIDHIRLELEKETDDKVKSYLLACGLEALSKVSNTTGVQAAYLKTFKARALTPIAVRAVETVGGSARAWTGDILSLLKSPSYRNRYTEDILYIDPPYTSRQYGPNYHLYETFVRYDNPTITGKTGLRGWKEESRSSLCSAGSGLAFLREVVDVTRARDVFISYSSDGIIPIESMALEFTGLRLFARPQKRYKSDSVSSREYNQAPLIEYLMHIHKGQHDTH
jgi:adenine-specific DNA-methyltransferase